jgi:ParB family chromosome partitioning protein
VLLRLKDDDQLMQEIRGRIIREELSVRETERLCRRTKSGATVNRTRTEKKRGGGLPPSYCRSLTTQIINHLNTKVRILQNGERGKLEIEYYSSDDLDRLVTLLTD